MNETNYLYSVSITRWRKPTEEEVEKDTSMHLGAAGGKSVEYYVAHNIKTVIEKIKNEFDTEDCEVTEIKQHVPVLAVLEDK